MPKINHRRKQGTRSYGKTRVVEDRYPRKPDVTYLGSDIELTDDTVISRRVVTEVPMHNGYIRKHGKHLDKSMHGWGDKAPLSDKRFGAGIGNDFSNGNRGMAKAVRGAKKFVRSRVRFHENAETKRLAQQAMSENDTEE